MTQTVYLTLNGRPSQAEVFGVCGDKNLRKVRIVLRGYRAQEGDILTLRATKADGNICYLTGTADETGAITVPLSDQMLTTEGDVRCDLSIARDGGILSGDEFTLRVRPAAASGSVIESSNEFQALQALMEQIGALAPLTSEQIDEAWEAEA